MDREATLAAVILAGHSAKEQDLLAEYSLGRSKALISIAGRPMIAYVVEALAGSQYIKHITVVGLPPEDRPPLPAEVSHIPNQGSMLANAEAGVREAFAQEGVEGVLVGSADLPLITPEIVDRFIATCLETEHDLYYSVVERSVMEGQFPESHRTYIRLVEGEFAGGDLFLVRSGAVVASTELWQRLSEARKNPLKQVRMLGGTWPLIKLLARRLSLPEAERRASEALGIHGRVVVCPQAELGMDVDKPFQLEIARAELEGRWGGATG